MAFQQVTVENRVSEFPNRRTLTKEDNTTEIVTVTRNEGNVSTEGTAWGDAYANDLESRINTETNLLETNFGHVETNTTASKPYSVGEALVLNGQMYKVTAAIAQGAALVVGTNIAVHSVSAINSNLVYDSDTGYLKGYKTGADTWRPFKSYYDLGVGTSFDLSSYPDYQKFTIDNFICQPSDINNNSARIGDLSGVEYASCSGKMNITYTSSSGNLSAYYTVSGRFTYNHQNNDYGISANASVHAYLIV